MVACGTFRRVHPVGFRGFLHPFPTALRLDIRRISRYEEPNDISAERVNEMNDADESKFKAEIDQIMGRIDSILKKVDERSPAREGEPPTEESGS